MSKLSPVAWILVLLAAAPSGAEEGQPQRPGPRIRIRQPVEKLVPPKSVALPPAGEHPAVDLLTLAGLLTGRAVRLEGERVRETKVSIAEDAAGREVTLEELTLILAAHRLYLFPITDPKEGEVLVASRNPRWKEEPRRFTKVIEVSQQKSFKAAWEKVEAAVKGHNEKLEKGAQPIVAVPDERTGKIVLGGNSQEQLAELASSFAELAPPPDPDRPRLYTYTGAHRKAEVLQKALEEELARADLDRLRIVISAKGNRLLFRTPAAVWERVEAKLKEIDTSEKARSDRPPAK